MLSGGGIDFYMANGKFSKLFKCQYSFDTHIYTGFKAVSCLNKLGKKS